MTLFRPCIDLHEGKVKQIVGSSLTDQADGGRGGKKVVENFVSADSAAHFARRYAQDQLRGGHLIKLGPGNDDAASAALAAYPGGLQLGGGVNSENAFHWLDAGASHVIVTSWLFDAEGKFQLDKLKRISQRVGKRHLVVDLSCKRLKDGWKIVMNRWQTVTDLSLDYPTLDRLTDYCDEFLIHAADVEGLCNGMDQDLVRFLGGWNRAPLTYAGGIASLQEIEIIEQLSGGTMDVTVGSSLDLFGGSGVSYQDLLDWNASRQKTD
jgi:phosphoribosylformimino-5-aminoimidazole carboxamide ribotide isomerase